jgi:Fe-S-cluster formation regulator IscX/YfhJ
MEETHSKSDVNESQSFKQAVGLSLLTINERLESIRKIIGDPKTSVVNRFRELHNEIIELENLYDSEIRNLAHTAANLASQKPK